MAFVADDGDMTALLITVFAFVLLGVLAVLYGADSRHLDPRDPRPNWF